MKEVDINHWDVLSEQKKMYGLEVYLDFGIL